MVSALASAAIGGGLQMLGGMQANSANKKIAREQMKFQLATLQNQHQWQVADLRAAGLNPRLSATLGGAGSAPGASYSAMNEMAGFGSLANETANTANTIKRTSVEMENMRAQNDLIKAQAKSADNLGKLYSAQSAGQHQTNRILKVDADVNTALGASANTVVNAAGTTGGLIGQLAPYVKKGVQAGVSLYRKAR